MDKKVLIVAGAVLIIVGGMFLLGQSHSAKTDETSKSIKVSNSTSNTVKESAVTSSSSSTNENINNSDSSSDAIATSDSNSGNSTGLGNESYASSSSSSSSDDGGTPVGTPRQTAGNGGGTLNQHVDGSDVRAFADQNRKDTEVQYQIH